MRNVKYSNSTLINCAFVGNSAGNVAGGMHNLGSSVTLINCAFVGNSSRTSPGGLKNLDKRTILTNSIFWGNRDSAGMDEAAQLYWNRYGMPIVNYSCIQGWTGDLRGRGNHGNDPLFVDTGRWDDNDTPDDFGDDTWIQGNYHLKPGSPCIDAGDNTAVPADITTDLGGGPRFLDDPLTADRGKGTAPVVEMGAYEFFRVFLDIKPGACPNPLNAKSKGKLSAAVLGTEDFDVTTIDPATILLTGEGFAGSITPILWSYGDVATPFEGQACDCHDLDGDGYLDLTLKFSTQDLVQMLGLDQQQRDTILPLILTGNLNEENVNTASSNK